MIVAISGTPATGKTSAAKALSKITGWELISLNDLAERKGLYKGYDEERCCRIVDTGRIRSEVEKLKSSDRNLLIESHYAHEMPADLVVVLRTKPQEMRRRGKDKGWDFGKTEENVMAEIMEVCKSESLEKGMIFRELDTTGKTAEQSAKELSNIMQHEGLFVADRLKISAGMRNELREPYGELFKDLKKAVSYMKGADIVAVGDEACYTLHSAGITPDVLIVDGKIRRKPTDKTVDVKCQTISAKNETGYISNDLWKAVDRALKAEKPVMVRVDGEEDMAVLPAVILGREGSCVIYGLFDRGVCVVKIDDDSRKTARNVLKRLAASQ
jgi:broad-specificity NMP kinase